MESENLTKNQNIEPSKSQERYKKIIDFLWEASELLLFFGIVLYGLQPIVVLCGRAFSLPFTVNGVFFSSSIISMVAICIRVTLYLCIKFSFKEFSIEKLKNGVLGKWELVLLLFAFIWTFISCLVAQNQAIVWGGNNYNVEGFFAVLKYGVIFLDAYLIRDEKLKKVFCSILVVSATIMGVILLYTNLQGVSFYYHFTRSVYRNSNHYGYALAVSTVMAVGLAIKEKKIYLKAFYIFSFAILHANMLVSDCLGSFIGEIIGITFLFLISLSRKKDKSLLIVLLSVIIVLIVVTALLEGFAITDLLSEFSSLLGDTGNIVQGDASGDEGSGRWELWTKTASLILKVPLFGKGLDCYYGNDFVDGTLDMPHNEFLQIASNVGLPALIFYLVAIISVFVRAIKNRKSLQSTSVICLSCALAYLVSAMFGNTFTYTYPFLLIVLAFGMIKKRSK